MEDATTGRPLYKLTLRFAGEALYEPFQPGRDGTTVRLGAHYPPGRLEEEDYVRLYAPQIRRVGFARVTGVVHNITFEDLLAVKTISGERTPYQEPAKLVRALRRMYPEATEDTSWTVIGYRTIMSGPWYEEDFE